MILVSNLGTEITTIVGDRAVFASLTSEVIVEVIVIVNLGLR
jgi:hypothetical protein